MLEIKNLTYKVDDENDSTKEIIDDLNLTVGDGKFVVITGPNGGGKSTLAKLIMGVNQLTSGQIILDGEDISDKNITERAKLGVSFAFQAPVHFKGIRVIDLLRLAAGKNISVAETCDYLSRVGLCCPVESLSVLRLLLCWLVELSFLSLMSRKLELIYGASKI